MMQCYKYFCNLFLSAVENCNLL